VSQLTPESIREALREVLVPGTKVDIVKINLVGEITVDGGDVVVEIIQTSEKDETIDAVGRAAHAHVAALDGVKNARVDVMKKVEDKQQTPAHGPQNPDPWADRKGLPGVKRIVAVASGKGGVGKSTVSVNLALALKEQGYKVGLLDADIYGPSLTTMLGVNAGPEAIGEKEIKPAEAHGMQCISMGMLVPDGEAMVWRGPMVMAAVRQFLKDVQWSNLDYLVIDMPPGTGDAQLTLVQQVPVDGVVMVTTPQELALADVRRGIQMFAKVDVKVVGVIENMSRFICPDTGKSYAIFGEGGGAKVAKEFNVDLLGEIPLDPRTREGGDSGQPVVEQGDGPTRDAFLALAKEVGERVAL
jgi:ATP-binding protein involved in chromosome partitioning